MKILVPIKRVIDAYVRVRVKADHSGVETANVKMAINPFDEIAIEEAVRIKEAGDAQATEVILVSIGNQAVQESLRNGLALGADRALHILTDDGLEPLFIAQILAHIVAAEQPDLVLMGKQAIDDDNNQTGQMLAGLLDWPQATFASAVVLQADGVQVTREIDGGLQTLAMSLPAVITTDLRLNVPRYASLPNIMKAKNKPLTTTPLADLGLTFTSQLQVLQVTAPAERSRGVMVASVEDLVSKLRDEEHVIP